MTTLHDICTALLSGLATKDTDGRIHWGGCEYRILDADQGEYTVVDTDGGQHWYKNGQRHRENAPAVVNADGSQVWYKNGRFHRDNGPAIIWPGGIQEWWENGRIIK